MDTVERFNDRAADYVKFRPSYPAAAIDALLDGLGPPEQIVAADVGAGTGISSRLLGDRGVRVVAIEPGGTMRSAAEPHANVSWMAGRAEATGLVADAVDLVVCAQSFHWFRPPEALAEFAKILKPHGRLALVWNRRSQTDPFTAGYRQAIIDVGGEVAAEAMPFDPDVIPASGEFTTPERLTFPNAQCLDLNGLIGRAQSASYVPKSGASGQRLLELLTILHTQYADERGMVTLVYETEIFRSHTLSV
jgi:SAM-dependent methyltransferase